MSGKTLVDATENANGTTTSVRLSGNKTDTSVPAAVRLADKGLIEGVHAVHPKNGAAYIRSNPNSTVCDNIDTLSSKKAKGKK